ncbi:proteic killer suppression protein [Reichenbachiella faecimaris]|uniref:Proteic killer suppression protein n=1 Tax=Reichenbachiella faecimaris TaxID=692418 RepID=A0A1W2GI14_REIFA|nr:type II toxin-antitoxin system RelE/ParE family toxin [Reichenbachiella faecimaris]SMD36211.1 proteic killer suppression protein [Reichenbachiella faecimaris]
MIVSFSCKETQKVGLGQYTEQWDLSIRRTAMRRLDYLDSAINLEDLRIPPSNRLHALKGNLKGYYSISINMKWRIVFIWKEGNAYDVKITDYH